MRRTNTATWPAPVYGLARSGAVQRADPRYAEVLRNFIPTAQGARLRGGASLFATVDAPVVSLFSYKSGSDEALFAATAGDIFDITAPADAAVAETPVVSGFANGNWSTTQFATAGGQFMVGVNGADFMHYYDGTDWNPISGVTINQLSYDALVTEFEQFETVTGATSGASAQIQSINKTGAATGVLKLGTITGGPFTDNETITSASGEALANGTNSVASSVAVTGINTRNLSFVFSHKSRQWFIEKNSLSAWYLPVDSIGGAASEFPMTGVFALGGALLFGGTWSVDSGSGLDDIAVFVTTEGEIAVYQGTDPSSASTWALVGVYRIGRPLGKNTWFQSGKDFFIMSEDGIVSISDILNKDRAELQAASITAIIEDLWQSTVALRTASFAFSVSFWPTRTIALIGVPNPTGGVLGLVVNTRTQAWAEITGWDIRCSTVYANQLYMGTNSNQIAKLDSGGSDLGTSYTGYLVPKFQDFGNTSEKFALHCKAIWKANAQADIRLSCFNNYRVGTFPAPGLIDEGTSSLWSVAVWGRGIWGGSQNGILDIENQAVDGYGVSLAPALVIASDQTGTPVFEILSLSVIYEMGREL